MSKPKHEPMAVRREKMFYVEHSMLRIGPREIDVETAHDGKGWNIFYLCYIAVLILMVCLGLHYLFTH